MKNRKKEFKDCNLEILFRLPFCLACSIDFRLKTVHSTLIQISSLSTCQSIQSSLTPSHGLVVPHDDVRNRPWALQAPQSSCSSRLPRTLYPAPWSGCWKALEEEHLAFLDNLPSSWADRILSWASLPVSSGTDESVRPGNTPSAHWRLQKLVVTFH